MEKKNFENIENCDAKLETAWSTIIIIRTFLNCVRSQNHHLIPSNSRIKEKEVNRPKFGIDNDKLLQIG